MHSHKKHSLQNSGLINKNKMCDSYIHKSEGISIKASAPGKVILHGEHSVVYGKLALAGALGLRSTVQLTEIEPHDAFIVTMPTHFYHRYNLQEINNLLCIPITSIDSKDFSWEFPENVHHENLLDKTENFIKNIAGNKFNGLQITSQKCLFYLIFGILGSAGVNLPAVHMVAETQLQIGAGTGSSASFVVSLAALLVHYVKLCNTSTTGTKPKSKPVLWEINLKEFNEKELHIISTWAFNAEKIVHGTPSGVDTTVCTYGSIVEFRKGDPLKLIKLNSFIKILLIDSKVNRETKAMVAKVAQMRQKYPKMVDNILNAMEEIALTAVENLKSLPDQNEMPNNDPGNKTFEIYEDMVNLVSVNHNLLASLSVSHPRLDEIIRILSEYGLHGKLTGAGGGGYAIAILTPTFNEYLLENVQKVLISHGFGVSFVTVGCRGVTIE